MNQLPFTTRRIIAGIGLAVVLLCLGNYYLDLNLFGPWGKKVMVLSFILLGLSQIFFGVTPSEVEEYMKRKRAAKQPKG